MLSGMLQTQSGSERGSDMFERLAKAVKGVFRKMFPLKTIKQVIGTKVVMSQSMVDKIEAWNRMNLP